jgi:hypothetical protein
LRRSLSSTFPSELRRTIGRKEVIEGAEVLVAEPGVDFGISVSLPFFHSEGK